MLGARCVLKLKIGSAGVVSKNVLAGFLGASGVDAWGAGFDPACGASGAPTAKNVDPSAVSFGSAAPAPALRLLSPTASLLRLWRFPRGKIASNLRFVRYQMVAVHLRPPTCEEDKQNEGVHVVGRLFERAPLFVRVVPRCKAED
jgi:hypothetical protein